MPIFVIDPLPSMPHDVAEQALLLAAVPDDVVFACNIRAATAVITRAVMGTL